MKHNKKLIIFGAGLVVLGWSLAFGRPNKGIVAAQDEYEVKNVIDGDTLEIVRFGKNEKVRFIGIDTPETLDTRKPVQCFGGQASQKSKDRLSGKVVRIEFDPVVGERDKYNRLLAYVWVNGTELYNLELLEQGFAHEYTYRSQSYKYQSAFKQAEMSAKSSGLGLWSSDTCSGITK